MKNHIKIFFLETDHFIARFIGETFQGHTAFSVIDNREEADIILKIEKDVCHFYAKERYETMTFPCDLEDFIRKIKLFFYEDAADHYHYNGFALDFNIFTFNDHAIELSDTEQKLVRAVLAEKRNGIEKLVLFNILGSGADAVLYRFRKKINQYGADLALNNAYYTLEHKNN